MYVSMQPAPWGGARAKCARQGGVLAAPLTEEETEAFVGLLTSGGRTFDRMWIGVSKSDKKWNRRDPSGATVEMDEKQQQWADGQPDGGANEICVEMWTTGKWNDAPCATAKAYACDVTKPPSSDFKLACSAGVVAQLASLGRSTSPPPQCSYVLFGADGTRDGSVGKRDFQGCEELCREQAPGSQVAEPRRSAELQYLAGALRGSGDDSMWIGATPKGATPKDGWQWLSTSDKITTATASWAYGQPDAADYTGMCIEMWDDATWNDRACTGDPFASKVCPCEVPVD